MKARQRKPSDFIATNTLAILWSEYYGHLKSQGLHGLAFHRTQSHTILVEVGPSNPEIQYI